MRVCRGDELVPGDGPGAALAGDQHEQLLAAVENTEALKKALTNEAEQKREAEA